MNDDTRRPSRLCYPGVEAQLRRGISQWLDEHGKPATDDLNELVALVTREEVERRGW